MLPATYLSALLLTILSMICWGSWANTTKLTGKWRFELYYFDYSFGVLLAAAVAAFTFGSMTEEITVMDNFLIASRLRMLAGFAGGVVFNLANILLVAAITIAGLAVAFPVGIGLALVIGVIWNYVLKPAGNPLLLFAGVALVVVAIVLDAVAYHSHEASKAAAGARKRNTALGIALSLVAGVLMGTFYPLVEMGKATDFGLGPYAISLVFAAGVFLSTFFFGTVMMNAPVEGPPLSPFDYFKGTFRQHILGVLGGIIWCVGAVSNFVAASAPREVNVSPAMSYAMGQGATMISALWGLLLWKEFAGSTARVKLLLALMMILFLAGLGMVSVAPLY